ncbi:PREDICTED: SNF1-related protein kinase regulatory subunit beta-1 [Nicotiana attenuata]|uniref:Snf1-related protein kinase regulatory subunit beta-1 n=1 Tax=Nicotiana attenuata TaxID=49451 RepID=A0A1J6IAY2_NICAT|nr:PREDICTED: SNF1-related protein kinase regulatory subunit beta-1 [Nicotiana attenuata]OIS97687.1 snf1-related protein kinase regulatory subunit beta-1 [Nicotiana attenuata]
MGNANAREDSAVADGGGGGGDEVSGRRSSNIQSANIGEDHARSTRVASADLMVNSPPQSPHRSASPLLFGPQVPVVPLQAGDGHPATDQMWGDESQDASDHSPESGIPILITWSYGGNNVAVQGSWDNWRSRKILQRSGKDHTILLVLPMGIYHYKFVVDGEVRYIPDLPCVADETGVVFNLLDVNDNVPENLESVAEFEAPPSPDSSYGQGLLGDEDFAKDPVAVPPQLHLTVLGSENSEETPSSPKPQHVVLNHLFIEKGWASQSVVALGLTHRFQSKYVTVVLYKPLKR